MKDQLKKELDIRVVEGGGMGYATINGEEATGWIEEAIDDAYKKGREDERKELLELKESTPERLLNMKRYQSRYDKNDCIHCGTKEEDQPKTN